MMTHLYKRAVEMTGGKNSQFACAYLYFLMYCSYELHKGAHLDLNYFVSNDKKVTSFEYNIFGTYAKNYLNNKELSQHMFKKCISLQPRTGWHHYQYALALFLFGDYTRSFKALGPCTSLEYEDGDGNWQLLASLLHFNTNFNYVEPSNIVILITQKICDIFLYVQ